MLFFGQWWAHGQRGGTCADGEGVEVSTAGFFARFEGCQGLQHQIHAIADGRLFLEHLGDTGETDGSCFSEFHFSFDERFEGAEAMYFVEFAVADIP